MSEFPTSAKVVVIGAGIVGNCLVGHLSRLGWDDIVLLDKGPLPNPGGSTGHASNFIFPVDHNKEMALLGEQSANQYRDMDLSVDSGGIEVARTQERMDELERRMTSATAWGIEAHLLSPAEVKELVPFINDDVILGGFYCPTVSVVDSLETGTQMRKEADQRGVLEVFANTEVRDLVTEAGPNPGDRTIKAVVTDKGTIDAEYVVIACGVWSNRIANMADAYIPLVPAVHQMADVGPIDILAETNNEIGYPIVRDMDTFCYERQSAGSMEVGSYAHRPIFHHPDAIPSNEEAALSPTEMPFTADDFDPQLEQALELMEMLGDAEIKYAINGLLSLTPDAMPCLGEIPEVRNLWSAAAVWVKEGPGMAQVVAEWMTHGYPRVIDAHGADVARFYEEEKSDEHIWARAAEHFNKTYGIVHPAEQWESRRNLSTSPYLSRHQELDAEFFQARTWERPQWFGSNADLVERYDLSEREVEWDNRWWSPITIGEHLNLRENCGVVDLSAFQIYELEGPGAVEYADYLAVNKVDLPGRAFDLHAVAHPRRRLPLRSHDDADGRRPGPDRDRRVRRGSRLVLGQASPADRRLGELQQRHHRHHDPGAVGSKRCGAARFADRHRPEPGGLALRLDRRRRRSPGSRASCFASPTSATRGGRSTPRGTTGRRCGTRCSRTGATSGFAPPAAGCTAHPAGSRRATASWGPSSRANTTRSRPVWPGPRSRPPTSSARRPTFRLGKRATPRSTCRCSPSRITPTPAVGSASCRGATSRS